MTRFRQIWNPGCYSSLTEKIKNKLKKLQDKNPEKFYMEYVTPLDVDLTSLEHYPSIEISKNDLQ